MTRALIDHLWQSTLFCAAIWSITLAMRANSAAVRHWLWQLASLKFLVPFSTLHLLGALAGLAAPVNVEPIPIVTTLTGASPVWSPAASLGGIASGTPGVLLPALLGTWIFGAACIALRWLCGWRSAVLLSRAARPAPGTLPDTFVTDADIEPSVARVFRPVVLLPAALLGRLSQPQLRAVLAHEREHIARHDILKAHVHHLVEALFWFHPLVWFIGRQLREERERACDEAVIARGHDPGDYAAGILAVCRHCAGVHSKHAVAALAGDLTHRIGQILNGSSPVSVGFVKAFALSTGTLLLAVAPLFAGAVDDAARRRGEVEYQARSLWDAQFAVTPVRDDGGTHARLSVASRELSIRNSSLRELVALAYGVESHQISARGEWFDGDRYDIRITLHQDMRAPETFSPLALRTSVNKLLASRFNIEIHVNQQCQYPCGWRALEASEATR